MARLRKRAIAGIVAAACVALIVGDANAKKPVETSSYNVPKAVCGPGDHPETACRGRCRLRFGRSASRASTATCS